MEPLKSNALRGLKSLKCIFVTSGINSDSTHNSENGLHLCIVKNCQTIHHPNPSTVSSCYFLYVSEFFHTLSTYTCPRKTLITIILWKNILIGLCST
jgi:hypothetical protein